ncbi:MAG: hypothetical protein ACI4EF_08570 [Coprococcus sp.]
MAGNENDIDKKERELKERLARIETMEQEIKAKEKAVKEKEKAKKQVLLRLAPSLWEELAKWADEDYRSINSQIEYLLAECVRKRKGK